MRDWKKERWEKENICLKERAISSTVQPIWSVVGRGVGDCGGKMKNGC